MTVNSDFIERQVTKDSTHHNRGGSTGDTPAKPASPKITPPRPSRLYARQRLFEFLDQYRDTHPLIWVHAPAGAGKTSLAASYLTSRELPTLWYQIDSGDADIASFFFYLGLVTAQLAPQHTQLMPVLKPEYLGDLAAFARNYFREMYRRLSHNFVIVFDNYQNAPPHSTLHGLLPVMLQELPQGLSLLVLSREEPPAALSRLRVSNEVASIDAIQLQLTAEESQGVSAIRLGAQQPEPDVLNQLHERSQGWAAGLVLLLEQARAGRDLNPDEGPSGQVLLFDYFAGEVFARFTAAEQDFLLKTALFNKVLVPAAKELSGNSRAAAILEDLTRRNYFTVQHAESYEYHPLFREFLLSRLVALTNTDELPALQQQAARLMFAAGMFDDAVDLLLVAGAWQALTPMLLQQAPNLILQGRGLILTRWISAIPSAVREAEPWLDYWLGIVRIAYNTVEARGSLERAHSGFTARHDRAGMLLCWAGIVETLILEFDDLTRLEPWIAWLRQELQHNPEYPTAAIELRVVSSMTVALLFRRDDSIEIRPWVERAAAALTLIPDLGMRCRLATYLALHATWTGDVGRLAVLAGQTRQWSDTLSASGHAGIDVQYAFYCQSLYEWTAGMGDFGRTASAAALAHVAHSGIHALEHHLIARGLTASLCQGELVAARGLLDQLRALAANEQSPRMHVFQYHNLPGWLSLLEGHHQQALSEAQESLHISQTSGATVFHRAGSHLVAGHALALMQRIDEVLPHVEQTLLLARCFDSPLMEFSALLLQAFVERERGTDNATLRRALTLGREQGFLNTLVWSPAVITPLCCRALEQGIETHYVQTLITARRLEPATPPVQLENWPWPLRIYTLGRFSILSDGQKLSTVPGKGHKKPLEMLQTLIALGGRQVGMEHLIEQLWPDAEGDAAANLFKITLHRLRKIVGRENTIEFAEGRVSLNPRLVWVDSWSLLRTLAELHNSDGINRALALYQGHFLALEPANNSALLYYRDQLRSNVLSMLKSHIQSCERRPDWELVIDYSARALTLDELDEDFHAATIRAYLALGRQAEALRAFERAHRRYAQQKLQPSAQLQALIQDCR